MKIQSLNGAWSYRIGNGAEAVKNVPFSTLPVGYSVCKKCFDLENEGKQVFLKLEGITYSARVTLNGIMLGSMCPYSEYVFDVTGAIKTKDNELTVELEDIAPSFGPTAGWQNYGGIIRDVYLLFANDAYISDVFFHTELKNGYRDAEYTVDVEISAPINAEIHVCLSYDGNTVDKFSAPAKSDKLVRLINNVKLWSTDEPNLYKLTVLLVSGERVLDAYECKVGFREIKCSRHRFIINGEPVFLQGVCKHEMYGELGHAVSEELIEKDLRMIKETGCNFVRLVHYPHSKKTLEIADRIGLMVSEEPGLWWSRTDNREVSEGSLEVLKRTVLRDRNHPCIAFWLCFNECRFTEQFLIDSARVCRKYDPTRMVSGANCMSNEDTLKYYNICGFDFYTMHPYADTTERAKMSAKILHDKPLLFTEWGGYHVYDNPHLLSDFIHEFYGMYKSDSDEGSIAGAFFWYFAECMDYGRAGPACIDGVLKEALVDFYRRPTLIYNTFCEAWADAKSSKCYKDKYYYEQCGKLKKSQLKYLCGGGDYGEALERAKLTEYEKAKFNGMRYRRINIGPVLQKGEDDGIALTPYVLSDGTEIAFDCGEKSDSVTVLGAVSMSKGYPINGEYGEVAATLNVYFADGICKEFPLRNGVEITSVYTTFGSSRIEPIGEKTVPFAHFGYDKNFENYLINTVSLPIDNCSKLERVTVTSNNAGYDLLIYGIYS